MHNNYEGSVKAIGGYYPQHQLHWKGGNIFSTLKIGSLETPKDALSLHVLLAICLDI